MYGVRFFSVFRVALEFIMLGIGFIEVLLVVVLGRLRRAGGCVFLRSFLFRGSGGYSGVRSDDIFGSVGFVGVVVGTEGIWI